jgi:hypothetical protein
MVNRKFGFHSGVLTCWNATVTNALTIKGDLNFGDASTDNLIVSGDLRINDDRFLHFGTDEDVSIEYDEDGDDVLKITGAAWQFSVVPTFGSGFNSTAQTVTANTDNGAASTINAGVTAVEVTGITNDANDWIILPSLADVPVGHTITIANNAGSNFELRTPAISGELINTVDSDGTNELLMVDTEIVILVKVSNADGWMARSFTALGADNLALVPD